MKRKAQKRPAAWVRRLFVSIRRGRPGESIEQEITRTRHGRRRGSWGAWIFLNGFRHGNLVDICRYPMLMTIYRRFKCRLSLYILNDKLFLLGLLIHHHLISFVDHRYVLMIRLDHDCRWLFHLPQRSFSPIGSMVLLYMVTWIPSIYPSHVGIYTSTMDPMARYLWLSIRSMNHSANTSNKSTIGSVLSTTTVGHFGPGNLGQHRKRWKTPIATKWHTITIWERSLWCWEYWLHVNSDVIATPASRTRSVGSIEENLRSNTYPTSDHICTYTI